MSISADFPAPNIVQIVEGSTTEVTITAPGPQGPAGSVGALLAGSAAAPSLTFLGDTNTGVWSPGADTIAFTEGGVESMRIDSSGNLGIGTSAPTVRLHVSGQGLVSANSTGNAFEIRQTGSGNALVVEDDANPDSTPFVVTTNGQVIVGDTDVRSVGAVTNHSLQVDGAIGRITAVRYSADANGSALFLAKSRSANPSTFSVVQSGDVAGQIRYFADDGADLDSEVARIEAAIDGTPGANDMPGRLVFYTTADGAQLTTERMRITNAGRVGIGTASLSDPNPVGPLHLVTTVMPAVFIDFSTSGNAASQPSIAFRRSRGTAGSPTAVLSGDSLGHIVTRGYGATGYASGNRGQIGFAAEEDWTDTAQGTRVIFSTVANGTASVVERMRIDNAGLITGTGTSLGAWTAYTPTLTAATTNPTLGTGSLQSGSYCQIGKTVHFRARINFGTTGAAAGSGKYLISLPVASALSGKDRTIGSGFVTDASAVSTTTVSVMCSDTNVCEMYFSATTNYGSVTASAPYPISSQDVFTISGTYEAA